MRRLFWIFLVSAELTLLPSVYAAELVGRVISVTDGDTVTLLDRDNKAHKIRLAGIDAPEKRQAFGQRSKEALSDAVFDRNVTVVWSKRDKYGRLVGKIILPDGSDANLRQIELGLAWHYKRYEREQSTQDRHDYAKAELQARQARVGLWLEPQSVPPWEYRHGKE